MGEGIVKIEISDASLNNSNNLGGMGPDTGFTEATMRFYRVGVSEDGRPFDMVVRNTTEYAAHDDANGLQGADLGKIYLQSPTSYTKISGKNCYVDLFSATFFEQSDLTEQACKDRCDDTANFEGACNGFVRADAANTCWFHTFYDTIEGVPFVDKCSEDGLDDVVYDTWYKAPCVYTDTCQTHSGPVVSYVALRFEMRDTATNEPVALMRTHLTFYDLDQQCLRFGTQDLFVGGDLHQPSYTVGPDASNGLECALHLAGPRSIAQSRIARRRIARSHTAQRCDGSLPRAHPSCPMARACSQAYLLTQCHKRHGGGNVPQDVRPCTRPRQQQLPHRRAKESLNNGAHARPTAPSPYAVATR